MKTSRDPLQPLRCWKELFLGERASKTRKSTRERRHSGSTSFMDVTAGHAVAGH